MAAGRPGLSRLARLLHQEHLDTLALFNALEARSYGPAAGRPLDGGEAEDGELARRLIAVTESEIVGHFVFEEAVLFPIVWELGAADMVTMLTAEHGEIGPLAKELASLAAPVAAGASLDAAAWSRFRDLVGDLVHAALFHIQKEEMGLIQRLGVLLDAATDAALAERYERGEH